MLNWPRQTRFSGETSHTSWIPRCPVLGLRDRFTSISGTSPQISNPQKRPCISRLGRLNRSIRSSHSVCRASSGSFHDPYKMASVNEGMAHPTNERVQNDIGMLEPLR